MGISFLINIYETDSTLNAIKMKLFDHVFHLILSLAQD